MIVHFCANRDVLMEKHWPALEENWTTVNDDCIVKFISLLCQRQPNRVLKFLLKSGYETIPLDNLLDVCVKNKVTDGAAYVLERTGDFESIVDLYTSAYTEAISDMMNVFNASDENVKNKVNRYVKKYMAFQKAVEESVANNSKIAAARIREQMTKEEQKWWSGLKEVEGVFNLIRSGAEVCARNALVMRDNQRQELWFGFLNDTISRAQEASSPEITRHRRGMALHGVLQEVLTSVLTDGVAHFLPLQTALRHIADEFSKVPLNILRTSLGTLLRDLQTQQELVQASGNVSSVDVCKGFKKMMAVKAYGFIGPRGTTTCKHLESFKKAERLDREKPVAESSAFGGQIGRPH